MADQLEFEIERITTSKLEVVYAIKRKGLTIGMLGLNKSYEPDKERHEMIIK